VRWSDEVDDILAGDLTAAFAYTTPAGGVVIVPVAPLGLRERDAGTVTVTSSYGRPKKLDRLRRNPAVALAYHAREHGFSGHPHFVLVQGTASVDERPDRAWLESITPEWERFLGPRETGCKGRWLDIYYWQRVAITIAVARIVVLEGPSFAKSRVVGAALPTTASASQTAMGKGTAPRVDCGCPKLGSRR
jgi:hypothetical protein